jgi:Ca-activated chloride channel homolog
MRTKILLVILMLCLAFVSTPRAQDPVPPTPPAGPMVGLSLIVTDKDGKGVNSIRKDQIRVSEDGHEQTVLAIEPDERPVDCVLLIDASGSFKPIINSALEAAKLFIVNRRPDDQISIVRFVGRDIIENTQEFTTDNTALLKGLDQIYLQKGQSAVVDALYIGADYVATHNKENDGRRKVVVIFSDGEDRNSYYSQEQLTNLFHETGVQVFILGMVLELNKEVGLIRLSPRQKAEKLLNDVADETGGRVFFPETKQALVDAAAQIILDLRAQFHIKYQSTRATKKGFRKVEVKYVAAQGDEKRNLITPRGYWFGPRTPAKSEKKKKS